MQNGFRWTIKIIRKNQGGKSAQALLLAAKTRSLLSIVVRRNRTERSPEYTRWKKIPAFERLAAAGVKTWVNSALPKAVAKPSASRLVLYASVSQHPQPITLKHNEENLSALPRGVAMDVPNLGQPLDVAQTIAVPQSSLGCALSLSMNPERRRRSSDKIGKQ